MDVVSSSTLEGAESHQHFNLQENNWRRYSVLLDWNSMSLFFEQLQVCCTTISVFVKNSQAFIYIKNIILPISQ